MLEKDLLNLEKDLCNKSLKDMATEFAHVADIKKAYHEITRHGYEVLFGQGYYSLTHCFGLLACNPLAEPLPPHQRWKSPYQRWKSTEPAQLTLPLNQKYSRRLHSCLSDVLGDVDRKGYRRDANNVFLCHIADAFRYKIMNKQAETGFDLNYPDVAERINKALERNEWLDAITINKCRELSKACVDYGLDACSTAG